MKKLQSWVWRWHFIGGIVTLPIIVLLSITGTIYLFKDNYEKPNIDKISTINPVADNQRLSYQQQWEIVQKLWQRKPEAVSLTSENKATEFTSGRFSHKSSFYLHPFTGEETGRRELNKTDMYKVRKLHGELLLGKIGTKIVELVASWMIVLLITGVYLFFPKKRGWRALFSIRTKKSKRILYRDIHAFFGFWSSVFLLLILFGGLPWTDVFGFQYKWLQNKSNSGYPATWHSRGLKSKIQQDPLPLDVFVKKAQDLNLDGQTSIVFPKSKKGVFSISNQTGNLSKMTTLHFDQYSGKLIKSHTWNEIGRMMKLRLWLMAFHQGQFGIGNFILVFITSLVLFVLSIAAILSYVKRKKKGEWSVPKVPNGFKLDAIFMIVVILLGILLPLFGISVLIIFFVTYLKHLFFIKK